MVLCMKAYVFSIIIAILGTHGSKSIDISQSYHNGIFSENPCLESKRYSRSFRKMKSPE